MRVGGFVKTFFVAHVTCLIVQKMLCVCVLLFLLSTAEIDEKVYKRRGVFIAKASTLEMAVACKASSPSLQCR